MPKLAAAMIEKERSRDGLGESSDDSLLRFDLSDSRELQRR
jgi:hypothetical protein